MKIFELAHGQSHFFYYKQLSLRLQLFELESDKKSVVQSHQTDFRPTLPLPLPLSVDEATTVRAQCDPYSSENDQGERAAVTEQR